METLAKGKLSYYVLSCLSERDMYGLELIDQIKLKFGIDIKLPSLYSNLNRMKELKFVSTYLKESTKGPKCSYSSITEKGRNELENLKQVWENEELEIIKGSQEDSFEEKHTEEFINKDVPISDASQEEQVNQEVSQEDDDYDDYFSIPDDEDTSNKDEEEEKLSTDKEIIDQPILDETNILNKDFQQPDFEEVQTDNDDVNNNFDEEFIEEQIVEEKAEDVEEFEKDEDFSAIEETSEITLPEEKSVENDQSYYENKKLFDITQDFSKYRKKKSFTENQIVMNVNTSAPKDEVTKANDISSLKQTIENSKEGNYEPIDRFARNEEINEPKTIELTNEYEKFNKETKDDGLFITDRIPVDEIPKAKKIEMSKLSFTVPTDLSKLPAPNRDSSLDPTHSDIQQRLQKLYEKTSASTETQVKYREYETFEDLKEYYNTQDIDFKVYNKPEVKVRHNTNKLLFFVEMVLFGMVGCISGLLYWIFSSIGAVNQDLSFLYYLFPVISFVLLVYKFYNYKFSISRLPKSMLNSIIMWFIFLLGSVVIFCFSLICGLNISNPITYCTCIIFPILVLGILLPVRYYLTLHFYKKFWR